MSKGVNGARFIATLIAGLSIVVGCADGTDPNADANKGWGNLANGQSGNGSAGGAAGIISGTATFEDGRPIPSFKVTAMGFTGEVHIDVVPGGLPSLGMVEGANGNYQLSAKSETGEPATVATVVGVSATAPIEYMGKQYTMELAPEDGLRNGTSEGDFRGDLANGVVRNFILKVEGPRPGAILIPKDTDDDDTSTYYGGTVYLDVRDPAYGTKAGETITLSLTPNGPLMGGRQGQPITRSFTIKSDSMVGSGLYFHDIPIGSYSATATLTRPDGQTVPLRLGTSSTEQTSPYSFVFEPWEAAYHVSTARLYARQ